MKISIFQTAPKWRQIAKNINLVDQWVQKITSTDLILLPEMWSTGFCVNPPLSSPEAISAMKKWARQKECTVIGTVYEPPYNQMLIVDPQHISKYNKRHLFSMGGETQFFKPGKEKSIIKISNFRILMQICYDLRFPVFSRCRNNEYDAIIYCAAWPQQRMHAWHTLLAARAIENQAWVIGVNRTGEEPSNSYCGQSAIYTPNGICFLKADNKEGIYSAEIDLSEVLKLRQTFPTFESADNFKLI